MIKIILVVTVLLFTSCLNFFNHLFFEVPLARNFKLIIDPDSTCMPTPINKSYLDAINSAEEGDELITFQKYYKNININTALVSAVNRKVKVTAIYRDELEPNCDILPLDKQLLCRNIFIKSSLPHHKSMMIQYSYGLVRAIIGSYNPREQSTSKPRVHTALTFDIINGRTVFDFYCDERDRLIGKKTIQPKDFTIDTEGGGILKFQMHPSESNSVLELLNSITTFESTLWVSFYSAGNDHISQPVYDKLKKLSNAGCDVRVLLDSKNSVALKELKMRGVPVQYPVYSVDSAMLGHKLVMIRSGGNLHLIQSSANLTESHYYKQHNLTLYLKSPGLAYIQRELENELNRYWIK